MHKSYKIQFAALALVGLYSANTTIAQTAYDLTQDAAIIANSTADQAYTDQEVAANSTTDQAYTDQEVAANSTADQLYTDGAVAANSTADQGYADAQDALNSANDQGYTDQEVAANSTADQLYTDGAVAANSTADQGYADAQDALNSANDQGYTDQEVAANSTADQLYTDQEVAAEVNARSQLINSIGNNVDGNQIVHIGDNSLVTQELGGEQQLHAEDAAGNAIDIVVTNGSDLVVRTQDPAATNSNIGINSGLTPQIVDPDLNDTVVPVVTTRDGIGSEKIDFTNSGVTIAQNGDVTLLQSAGTQLNVELGTVTSFDVDANTGVPVPGSQRWVAGYYTDTDGNIVNVSDFAAAVLADPATAGDYTFTEIVDPRFSSTVDEATLIGQLQAIEPDDAVFNGIVGADGEPLVASTTLPGTGGNLQVGGNANVDGVLSVADNGAGGVADVDAAINGNTDAIAQEVIDRVAGDAATLASANNYTDQEVAANSTADQAYTDQEVAANSTADQAYTDAREAAITSAYQAADTNLQSQISKNREDIDANTRGIAMVAALQHTTVLPGMTHALDISGAHFEGETGMALNYARRINDNVQINFGAASTTDFEESVIKAGVGIQW